MPQSIVSIEFEIPGHSEKQISFSANNSLLDHDVVIFSPDISDYLIGSELFQGKRSISENRSFQLKQQITRWRTELLNAFNHGKTIFVLMHQPQDVFVDSGNREYNGTGRNRQTTTLVEPLNSYSVLPIVFEELMASNGKEIRPAAQLGVLASFWSEFSEYCSYETYFSSPKIVPLLSTKTGSKTVGGILRGDKTLKKGAFVFLPPIRYERSKFTQVKKDKTYWNKEGIAWGSRFISCVLEIDKALRATTASTPTPTWAQSDQFRLNSERQTESEIASVTEKISSLEVEKEKLQQQLLKDAGLRRLLFETGLN